MKSYSRGVRTGPRISAALQRAQRLRRARRRSSALPPDLEETFQALHRRCAAETMTSAERMYGLWQAVRHVQSRALPGAFVECGVWRGGSSMLAALTLLAEGETSRDLYLYDTFRGMSEPTERDVSFRGYDARAHWNELRGERGSDVLAYADLATVRANLARTGYPPERVHFVAGKVEDTIPNTIPPSLAILRLDTDWYASTRHELEHLYPRLEPGGVLIVDDYGHWRGARDAVDEYFANSPNPPLLQRLDYTGRMGVKLT